MNKIAPNLDQKPRRKRRKPNDPPALSATSDNPKDQDGGDGAAETPESEDDKKVRLKKAEREALLARARKRFDRCVAAESENRKEGLDDLKFKAGDQWPADIRAQRSNKKRPCLTINKMKTFVNQVTNDLRQNRPSINVSPVGDRGDIEVAKMYRGLIRAIERDSAADIAYDTAADNAVSNGWGYCRLLTEYEKPRSFSQVIHIKRVRNPFTVYLDPDHQEPDGADAKYGFVTEMMPRSEFSDQHPNAQQMAWTQSGIGDTYKHWVSQDSIRVAEYYEVVASTRTLVALSTGYVGWEDDLSEAVLDQIKAGTITIDQKRESQEHAVKWYKITATEVLEEMDTVWDEVPIIKFIGNEIDIEGKPKLSGIIRDAKDPQRMLNYWTTCETEVVALAPKAPFIVAEGQIEGYESQWKQANVESPPYLQYVPVDLKGRPVPPPQRQQPVAAPQGVIQAKMGAAQDMMATTGIRFDATLGERMQDESGRAIRELRRSGDLGSFHYADNMARSLRRIGKMLIRAIPKVYDTPRVLTILREDDSEEQVRIDPNAPKPFQETKPQPNQQNPNPKTLKIFNPTYGEYGCTVTIGPSYATKRIEAAESMIAFAKAVPQVAPVIADLIAKNMDWPGADQIATRLAKTLPANLLAPEIKDIPPQIQALLQKMGEQIQGLSKERAALIKQITDQDKDRAVMLEKINKDFEAKLLAVVQKAQESADEQATKNAKALGDQVFKLITAFEKMSPDNTGKNPPAAA